jgi:hypothetical protein
LGWVVSGVLIVLSLIINRNDRIAQGPWLFTEQQLTKFESTLANEIKGKVAIEYSNRDAKRVRGLALKLKEVLAKSGYDVWGYVAGFIETGELVTGFRIEIVKGQPSDSVGAGIQRALIAAGFETPGYTRAGNNYPEDTAVIYVGMKP